MRPSAGRHAFPLRDSQYSCTWCIFFRLSTFNNQHKSTNNRSTCTIGGLPLPFACRWRDLWSGFLMMEARNLQKYAKHVKHIFCSPRSQKVYFERNSKYTDCRSLERKYLRLLNKFVCVCFPQKTMWTIEVEETSRTIDARLPAASKLGALPPERNQRSCVTLEPVLPVPLSTSSGDVDAVNSKIETRF